MDYISFNNTMTAAQVFSDALTSSSEKKIFTPRPWNRFKPEDTTWWVVPSTKWPAYKYGKYIFFSEGNVINFGINIEKGFGLSSCKAYPKLKDKGLVVDPNWAWNDLISDLSIGLVEEKLREVQELYQQPIYISIGSGLASDPVDYDPFSPKTDAIDFIFENGQIAISNYTYGGGSLEKLRNIKRLSQIPDILNSCAPIDWLWLDISIYIKFLRNSEIKKNNYKTKDSDDLRTIIEPISNYIKIK